MSDSLADVLEASRVEERRRALRALLRHPILSARGRSAPDHLLVRRHAAELREWLLQEADWHLVVDSDFARLRKRPATTGDATRPATDPRSERPFTRRRYALFCLALATLERADTQVTLGRLADDILVAAVDPKLVAAGMLFDLQTREQRFDLVSAVRLLGHLAVLIRIDGDEEAFLDQSGDALYEIDRRLLSQVLVTARGPSVIAATSFEDRLAALGDEPVVEGAAARTRIARQRLTRRLLDDPVVHDDELGSDEREYLQTQRHATVRRIEHATGLVAELRAEGIALLDPTGEATDFSMPEEGTEGHATLLLAEQLAALSREKPDTYPGRADLLARMETLVATHGSRWRRTAREPGGARELLDCALTRLEGLRLIRWEDDRAVPLPACARYALGPVTIEGETRERGDDSGRSLGAVQTVFS